MALTMDGVLTLGMRLAGDAATAIWQAVVDAPDSLAGLVSGAPVTMVATLEVAAVLLVLVGLPILALELALLWWRGGLDKARISGMATSFFCAVPGATVEVLLGSALVALFIGVGALAPVAIPVTLWSSVLCLLLTDLAYYCEHRMAHRVNLLWSLYHAVHHSAGHYDQSIAYRISFADFFFSPLIYLPLVLAGFHPVLVLACFGVVIGYQTWLHTELVGKLPWLDPWLNTPSNHRVHHGAQPIYLDKNYGGILIVWDRLFGSYQAEGERPVYGLTDPLRSANPLTVHGREAARLARGLWRSGSARAALRTVFGPPGT